MILSSVVITLVINYWIILPLIPLVLLFIYVRKYYLVTSIEIKRIEGANRSPIYVHLNNTVSGIYAIRACQIENKLFEEFNAHSDYHTRAVSAYIYITRWFGIRIEWISTIFIIVTLFSSIFLKGKVVFL
jgi:ATP-binding cassette subfamily C (CFTR/MRP) protein 4